MKKLIILFVSIIATAPVYAQKYLQVDVKNQEMYNSVIKNPKLGYGYCQKNQIILLDQLIKDSYGNIHKQALLMETEKYFQSKRLYDLLLKHIMLVKIKEQLRTKGLYNLILQSERSKSLSVLQLEKVTINIEVELIQALETSLNHAKWRDLSDSSVEYLKGQVYKEMLNSLIIGTYNTIINSEVRLQIGKFLAGQISKQVVNQALKTTLAQFGKNLLMNVGRGVIVEILTLPLTSYIQPKEGQLVDLWEDLPELIINPEWINPAGSKMPARYAWRTHCLAIMRKPERLEYIFNKFRIAERRKFNEALESSKR